MSDLAPLDFRQALQKEGFIVKYPVGTSMLPLLRQSVDSVVISPITSPLEKYDVVLYEKNGHCILHRIISVKNGNYIIRGDNRLYKETDVKAGDMIGIMTGYYRKDKFREVGKSRVYGLYVSLLPVYLPLRRGYIRVRAFLGKIKRRLVKKP